VTSLPVASLRQNSGRVLPTWIADDGLNEDEALKSDIDSTIVCTTGSGAFFRKLSYTEESWQARLIYADCYSKCTST
jgi:hypothetical protein